jgi:hypothetical protein
MQQRELAADAPWQQRRVLVVRLHHEPKTLELSEVVGVWSVVTIGIRTSRRSARTCAPALAAENSVLVLHREHINLIDVQEICGPVIRLDVVDGTLESNTRWLGVVSAGVVDRQDPAVGLRQ